METWKFYDITHKGHLLCNPMSMEKLDHLIGLCRLETGARVLEIACGKGEFLCRLAERFGITGTGIDISPYSIADARKKAEERHLEALLEFLQMDGAEYVAEDPESFDLTACIGASWIYGGHRGTLAFLESRTSPGGLLLLGEPFWKREPEDEYLAVSGESRETYGRHHENVAAGQELGLIPLYSLGSSREDWDHYETLQWNSVDRWVREHPGDPDNGELLERSGRSRTEYLRWGRDTLGWALYLFRRPEV